MPESLTPTISKQPSSLNHLRKKAMLGILRAWREVESTARDVIGADVRPSLPKEDIDNLRQHMRDCLNPKGGEISARSHTVKLGEIYKKLNATGRAKFFTLLAEEFDLDHGRIEQLLELYKNATTPSRKSAWETKLREALVTPRRTILRQFTELPDGFKFLVDMRADLMPLVQKDVALDGLEAELKSILSSWFDIAFLELAEITWDTAPAALLEKLIRYEAVHQIRSWDDLKNRLDSDRKIYAFFHHKMPLEPLIFVQVAFVKGFAGSIQELLDLDSPTLPVAEADTAIFYSISNAQAGLAGISFGNFLIKRVVAELTREYKHIKQFATLSPIPGFRGWLDKQLVKDGESLLTAAEKKALQPIISDSSLEKGLLALLNSNWHESKATAQSLKPVLMRLSAHYLLNEKKGARPRDPVSNFHLFNGARLERLNWLGDVSPNGMKQSAGMMVNYHYKLDDIDDNHEDFVREGKIVASKQVRGYL